MPQFTCRDNEYIVDISTERFYPKFFGIVGLLEIGYGKPLTTKAISFDLKNNYKNILGFSFNMISIDSVKKAHTFSHVKEFLKKLKDCLSEYISDNDVVYYYPVSESRNRLFKRVLCDNGWMELNEYSCFHKGNCEYSGAMFSRFRLFGTRVSFSISLFGKE